MKALRILVAERSEIVRTALVELLQKYDTIDVVDQAKSGREAILLSYSLHPHVLLLDHCITGTSRLDILKELRMVSPGTRIILLTSQNAETSRALREFLGVHACISKDNLKRDLLPALERLTHQLSNSSPGGHGDV